MKAGRREGRKVPECVIYACQILYGDPKKLDQVPADLVDRLTKANDNCRRLSGEITSRQVVALIVSDWERERHYHLGRFKSIPKEE